MMTVFEMNIGIIADDDSQTSEGEEFPTIPADDKADESSIEVLETTLT